jgi:hypothetical protein
MPYHIEDVKGGAFVVGPSGRKSKKPLTHEMAKKQMKALYVHMPVGEYKAEHKRLVKTLESGSKAKRMGEAARQRAEMLERLG